MSTAPRSHRVQWVACDRGHSLDDDAQLNLHLYQNGFDFLRACGLTGKLSCPES
jgi:hypothetical protein